MSVVAIPSALLSSSLIVRTATRKAEIDHLRAVLNQGHYLKAGRPVGHILWQGIFRSDAESGLPELSAGVVRPSASENVTTTSAGMP